MTEHQQPLDQPCLLFLLLSPDTRSLPAVPIQPIPQSSGSQQGDCYLYLSPRLWEGWGGLAKSCLVSLFSYAPHLLGTCGGQCPAPVCCLCGSAHVGQSEDPEAERRCRETQHVRGKAMDAPTQGSQIINKAQNGSSLGTD